MSSDVDLQTSPPPAVREARRTVSGKTLFLATLGAAALALVLALLAGITGLTWLGFVVPLAYAVYLVALLYLAGRAISFRDRPGEAATSVVLALLLVPLVALTPAVAVAGSLASGVGGLGGLLDGRLDPLLGGNGEASAGDDLPDLDAGEVPPGIQPGPEDYVLPPGTRIDITQSEYQQYQDCMDSLVSADVDVCWSIVT